MIGNLAVNIADLIESHLDAPEMARGSLHATLRFGEDLEQACVGTPLNGKDIRERLIPFRHGMKLTHAYKLNRLAKLLRADATYALAVMYLNGSSNSAICQAATTLPACTMSHTLRGELFTEDLGL